MSSLFVEDCGPHCSIQDMGRFGWLRLGLPRSGALDRLALAAANLLVANPSHAAAIEVLMGRLRLRAANGPVRLAVAGAAFPLVRNGRPTPSHASVLLEPGDILELLPARRGVCGIVAIEGGLNVPSILGSRSLHSRARIGGLDGRHLRPGDELIVTTAGTQCHERLIAPLPMKSDQSLRVVLGPQADFFSDETIEHFLSEKFAVSGACDRMAYRLTGPPLPHQRTTNMISDGIFEGAIQVTGAGQPIVMLADHQTIGGYPKIASVITPDLRVLANRQPGQRVTFQAISIPEARTEFLKWREDIGALSKRIMLRRLELDVGLLAGNTVSAIDADTWEPARWQSGARLQAVE